MKTLAPFKVTAIIAVTIVVMIALQLSSPGIVNPPVISEIQAPNAVKSILERACYDCHSNRSDPEWFSKIAPVSFFLADDVRQARSRFNFSDWNHISKPQQEVLLWEIVNAVEQQKMPIKSYRLMHPAADISNAEINVLKQYVNTLSGRNSVDTGKIIANANPAIPLITPVSLNGIEYSSDYKTWKVISTTDKYDSGTMRVVYGNDIMYKALQKGEIPFPDGAKIAKAVWAKQRADTDGNVFPGNFVTVQIMIKDSKKYKGTEGWGFARFDGLKLKPYGGTALFATACINCHRLLVKENDFVFNIPTKH